MKKFGKNKNIIFYIIIFLVFLVIFLFFNTRNVNTRNVYENMSVPHLPSIPSLLVADSNHLSGNYKYGIDPLNNKNKISDFINSSNKDSYSWFFYNLVSINRQIFDDPNSVINVKILYNKYNEHLKYVNDHANTDSSYFRHAEDRDLKKVYKNMKEAPGIINQKINYLNDYIKLINKNPKNNIGVQNMSKDQKKQIIDECNNTISSLNNLKDTNEYKFCLEVKEPTLAP